MPYTVRLTDRYPMLRGRIRECLNAGNVQDPATDLQLCEAARHICGEGSTGWQEGVAPEDARRILRMYGVETLLEAS